MVSGRTQMRTYPHWRILAGAAVAAEDVPDGDRRSLRRALPPRARDARRADGGAHATRRHRGAGAIDRLLRQQRRFRRRCLPRGRAVPRPRRRDAISDLVRRFVVSDRAGRRPSPGARPRGRSGEGCDQIAADVVLWRRHRSDGRRLVHRLFRGLSESLLLPRGSRGGDGLADVEFHNSPLRDKILSPEAWLDYRKQLEQEVPNASASSTQICALFFSYLSRCSTASAQTWILHGVQPHPVVYTDVCLGIFDIRIFKLARSWMSRSRQHTSSAWKSNCSCSTPARVHRENQELVELATTSRLYYLPEPSRTRRPTPAMPGR